MLQVRGRYFLILLLLLFLNGCSVKTTLDDRINLECSEVVLAWYRSQQMLREKHRETSDYLQKKYPSLAELLKGLPSQEMGEVVSKNFDEELLSFLKKEEINLGQELESGDVDVVKNFILRQRPVLINQCTAEFFPALKYCIKSYLLPGENKEQNINVQTCFRNKLDEEFTRKFYEKHHDVVARTQVYILLKSFYDLVAAGNIDEIENYLVKFKNLNFKVDEPSALYAALWFEKPAVLQLFLQRGFKVQGSEQNAVNLLALAIQRGQKELAEQLIDYGVDVELKNAEGETPLKLALNQGYAGLARKIMQKLKRSPAMDQQELAQKLSDADAEVEAEMVADQSVKSDAASAADTPVAGYGDGAIGKGNQEKNEDMRDIYLSLGADPNKLSAEDLIKKVVTPRRLDLLQKFLQKGLKLKRREGQGTKQTLGHLLFAQTITQDYREMSDLLLNEGLSWEFADHYPYTLVDLCLQHGKDEYAFKILEQQQGKWDKEEITRQFARQVQNLLENAEAQGENSLAGEKKYLQILIKLGANPNSKSKSGQFMVLQFLEKKQKDLFLFFLEQGLKLHEYALGNTLGYYSMEWAVKNDDATLVEQLQAHGLDLQEKMRDYPTWLFYAVKENALQVAEFLIKTGVPLDTKEFKSHGKTALELAQELHKKEMAELLQKSAKP